MAILPSRGRFSSVLVSYSVQLLYGGLYGGLREDILYEGGKTAGTSFGGVVQGRAPAVARVATHDVGAVLLHRPLHLPPRRGASGPSAAPLRRQ
jgi:hypothetical protein